MSLRDVKIPYETVKVGDAEVRLRGLGTTDLAYILDKHRNRIGEIGTIFGQIQEDQKDMGQALVNLMNQLPELVSSVIACGADDCGAEPAINKFPLPASVKMLKSVVSMTFDAYGGVEPFVQEILGMMNSTTGAINNIVKS